MAFQAQRLMAVSTATIGPNPRKSKVQRSIPDQQSYLDTNLNPLDNQGEPHVDNGAWMKMDNVDQNKQWEVVSHLSLIHI